MCISSPAPGIFSCSLSMCVFPVGRSFYGSTRCHSVTVGNPCLRGLTSQLCSIEDTLYCKGTSLWGYHASPHSGSPPGFWPPPHHALTTGSNGVPVTRLQTSIRPASSFPPRSPPNARRGLADSADEKASEPGSQGSVCRLIFFLLGTWMGGNFSI